MPEKWIMNFDDGMLAQHVEKPVEAEIVRRIALVVEALVGVKEDRDLEFPCRRRLSIPIAPSAGSAALPERSVP